MHARGVEKAPPVRMADVARSAKVSIATVSRAFSAPDRVSEPVRARVAAAARALRYRPDPIAGTLAGARSPLVCVIVPSVINAFFSGTLQAMSTPLSLAGYQLMMGNHEYDLAREEEIVAAFLDWRPAAMVVTGAQHTRRTRALLSGTECPVVEMWDIGRRPIDSMVGFSNRAAGRLAAEHLVARGGRRLAFCGAILDRDSRGNARRLGFVEAAMRAGGEEPVVHAVTERAFAAGGEAVCALIDARRPPDSVAFSSDVLALGALFELERQGIRVPDQLALLGYGDLEFSACSNPALSTVRPPRDAIGEAVAEHLVARLSGAMDERAVIDLGCELVQRGST